MSLTRPAGEIEFERDQDGYWTGTVRPWGSRAAVLAAIPDVGTAYSATFGAGEPWAAAVLTTAKFEESPTAKRGILTLTYSSKPDAGTSEEPGGTDANPGRTTPDNTPVYSMREGGLSIPIERVAGYKISWNHHLLTAVDRSPWSGFSAATALPTSLNGFNRVIRYDQSWEKIDNAGREWELTTAASKPGVDEKIISGVIVVETRWFSSKTAADEFAQTSKRGTKKTPADTFGVTGGEWLITDASLDPDGRRWQAVITYQHDAVGWDADLYGA